MMQKMCFEDKLVSSTPALSGAFQDQANHFNLQYMDDYRRRYQCMDVTGVLGSL